MQKKFLKWLFLVIVTAFLLTFSISYFVQTNQSEKVGVNLIRLKIADVKHQLSINEKNIETIKQMTYNIALLKANILAYLVYKNPELVRDKTEINKIAKLIDVDELHISDTKGVLMMALPEKYKGFDMSSTTQTKKFMEALTNPKFAFVQEPMPRGANGELFQYAGVARINIPGLIEIGYTPERLQNAEKLADINTIVNGFRIGKSGSILIIKDNEIISNGINDLIFNEKSKAELLKQSKNFGKSFKLKIDKTNLIFLSEQWKEYIIVGFLPADEMYMSRNSVISVLLLVNLVLFLIVFILVSILLKKLVIQGIYKINNSLQKITNGNLNEKIQVDNVEEFSMLSEGINTTVEALKQAIETEMKRLDDELELAKNIQHSALPNIFPPYPEHKEFDIYATMETAKEVGGDFYDFFFINPNHFAFLVADVSGKGIPAALFMMTAKTLINNLAKTGLSPQKLITKVNEQICKHNEQGLFVTLFLGVLELSTGKLVCVNAGHNPPLIRHEDGSVNYFKCNNNIVVGAVDHFEYKSCETYLKQNDLILLYTDGVTEANDKEFELYGEKRLINLIENSPIEKITVENILSIVNEDVKNYSKEVQQSDDITMLALMYNGFTDLKYSKKTAIKLSATKDSVVNLVAWLENICTQVNISMQAKMKLQIAVEEIFVNIASYAYPEKEGDVEISFQVNEFNNTKQVEMQFADNGIEYNPLENAIEPDITLSAEERQIGGLGIFMVKKSMDYVSYKYSDEKNILTIKMNL